MNLQKNKQSMDISKINMDNFFSLEDLNTVYKKVEEQLKVEFSLKEKYQIIENLKEYYKKSLKTDKLTQDIIKLIKENKE